MSLKRASTTASSTIASQLRSPEPSSMRSTSAGPSSRPRQRPEIGRRATEAPPPRCTRGRRASTSDQSRIASSTAKAIRVARTCSSSEIGHAAAVAERVRQRLELLDMALLLRRAAPAASAAGDGERLVVVERDDRAVGEDLEPLLRVVAVAERRVGQRADRAVGVANRRDEVVVRREAACRRRGSPAPRRRRPPRRRRARRRRRRCGRPRRCCGRRPRARAPSGRAGCSRRSCGSRRRAASCVPRAARAARAIAGEKRRLKPVISSGAVGARRA